MICSCCGYEISDKPHPIDDGTRYVCDRCWNNSNLFFPEKLKDDPRMRKLSELADEARVRSNLSCVEVIRLFQKDIEMYVGKMKSKDLLALCEIDKFEEEELTGYQREVYKERTSELVEYLDQCPVAVMPGLFVSLRDAEFISRSGNVGILKIPKKKGSVWIIDGQHRIGGFEKVRDRFVFERNSKITPELFSSLMDYELPVVFINSRKVAEKISEIDKREKSAIEPEDLERAIFFIVNKTQKGINPSLKDVLLYRIKMGGIEGIPTLKKESWRVHAAYIGIMLSQDSGSALANRINISGARGQGKPIQLNSFVSSLQPLFRERDFSNLRDEDKLRFVKAFWDVLGKMFPDAFDSKESLNYMLLKAIGIYSLNWLACDIFKKCVEERLNFNDETILRRLLRSLGTFDWKIQTSPLSALGGMKGVGEAHRLLLSALNSFAVHKPQYLMNPTTSSASGD